MRKIGKLSLTLLLLCGIPVAAQEAGTASGEYQTAAQLAPAKETPESERFSVQKRIPSARLSWAEQGLAKVKYPTAGLIRPTVGEANADHSIELAPITQEKQAAYSPQAYGMRHTRTVQYRRRRPDFRHDLRWTLGFAPMFDRDVEDWDAHDLSNPAYEVLHSKYRNSFFGRHSLGALSFQYAYAITERFEVSSSLSYMRFSDRLIPAPNALDMRKLREYYVSLMPGIRYSWICNRRFRFYSALEVGAQIAMRQGYFDDDYSTELCVDGQYTLLGMTIGRDLFFCCELGVGCRGILVVGMGWRLNSKNQKQ